MYSLKEFLVLASISRTTFYKLQKLGQAPAQTRILRRVLIAPDTAQEWLKRHEQQQP
jgi:predicted DNA-binding transcriptional regulator AlpA